MFGGFQLHTVGFSGIITITEGIGSFSVTPKYTDSPYRILDSLVAGATANLSSSYTWSLANSGAVTVSGSGAFDLAMSSAIQSLFNFSAASYSGITSATTTTAPDGAFFPYDDGDGVLFTRDLRSPLSQGFEVYQGGFWNNTPGTNLKSPILVVGCLRANVVEFMTQFQKIGSPAKVDLYDGGSIISMFLGNVSVNEIDPVDGWTRITLEVVR